MGKLFGTDGVRGVANSELTPEMAFSIGRAHGAMLGRAGSVVVGRDTRLSGPMLEAAYSAGLMSSGIDVVSMGVVPTPAVAEGVLARKALGGAMISASHNPVPDNGIKLFRADGFKLSDDQCRQLEELIGKAAELPRPTAERVGGKLALEGMVEGYHRHLFEVGTPLDGLRVVLDCAHGSACGHARPVFEGLGADVVEISADPDGARINVDCGSTHLAALRAAVAEHQAALGLAFDGDADRCLAVDEQGNEVDGDVMMLLFALSLKQKGQLAHNTVVATVMSNLGLEVALRQHDIKLERTAVGDRYVLAKMQELGAVLGGEQSGHILQLHRSISGDGLLTGLTLAGVLKENGGPMSELASQMPRYPQKLVNVPASQKEKLDSDSEIQAAIAAVEERLRERGRVLVRPSGTEPLVRVMAEGPDAGELDSVLQELSELIARRLA